MRLIIVYGKPLSGKTTYIKQHKHDNDIVLDYDYLSHAITLNDMYVKCNDVVADVLGSITLAILLELLEYEHDVYMPIASNGKMMYYIDIAEQYGIEYDVVHMDISIEDNLKRLERCTDNRIYQDDLKGLIEND